MNRARHRKKEDDGEKAIERNRTKHTATGCQIVLRSLQADNEYEKTHFK